MSTTQKMYNTPRSFSTFQTSDFSRNKIIAANIRVQGLSFKLRQERQHSKHLKALLVERYNDDVTLNSFQKAFQELFQNQTRKLSCLESKSKKFYRDVVVDSLKDENGDICTV